jgi:hypothetical protein
LFVALEADKKPILLTALLETMFYWKGTIVGSYNKGCRGSFANILDKNLSELRVNQINLVPVLERVNTNPGSEIPRHPIQPT